MTSEPGVYRSDVEGHLFVLRTRPVSVTCVICMESCRREDHKNNLLFKAAAAAFVNKHGYLDERIANNIAELIPTRKA